VANFGRAAQPFLEDNDAIQALFPPRKFAILIPAVLLVLGLSLAGAFVGLVLMGKKKSS
jgi:dolichyl-phosphate mannosyltransferase polypeptide 2 regulatory subunit